MATLRGSHTLEITFVARQQHVSDDYEVTVVTVHAPKTAGADSYTGEHTLTLADGAAIWEALPESVQQMVLTRCAEDAEPDDDLDPPSDRCGRGEEITDERSPSDVYEGRE